MDTSYLTSYYLGNIIIDDIIKFKYYDIMTEVIWDMKYQSGQVVQGIVTGIKPYGAFVKIDDNTDGLIHISEISDNYVNDVSLFVRQGEKIVVKVIAADPVSGQLKLSLKAVQPPRKSHMRYRNLNAINRYIGFKTLKEKLPEWIMEEKGK